MMTNLSLKFKAAKFVIAMAAALPAVLFAASAHADTTASAAATQVSVQADSAAQVSAFCAQVDSSAATLDSLISAKEASYETGSAANAQALAASRAASDKTLYNERVAANAEYAAEFKTLAATATTPAQQAAVAAFKKTVTQAVATRRANVDIAIQDYRDGVDAILAQRSSTYTSALETLKSTIDQTLSGSNPDCTGAYDAQSTFDATVSNLNGATDALSALASTRDAKIAAFDAKFNDAITAAAATLNAALGTQ